MKKISHSLLHSGALASAALGLAFALAAGGAWAAPPNDACANATAITSVPYNGSVVTSDAVDDGGDQAYPCLRKFTPPYPAGAVSKSVWFTFTPPSTDNYQIDTIGSTPGGEYDTIMAIFTGTCANLVPITAGCDGPDNGFDDAPGSLQSSVKLALSGGTTYTILVGAVGSRDSFNPQVIKPGSGGTLKLNIKRISISYPYRYVVGSVAHIQGLALYISDLAVTNVDSADGSFTVQFLGHGSFGDLNPPSSQPSLNSATISAGGTRTYEDILGTSFRLSSDYGALLISSTRRLVVGSNTYSPAASGGTFGQFALAYDLATEQLAVGEVGRFIGVREDASFRTNIAIFNTSNTNCAVSLEVHDSAGGLYASGAKTPVLPPYTMVQVSGLKNYFGISDDIRTSSVLLKNLASGCQVGGVAYVIDQKTQDPFAVPLKK